MGDQTAPPTDRPEGVRFGRTVIAVTTGDILAPAAEAVVLAANQRGVLGAVATPGLIGLRSLGGSEIERAAMALAPLELGTVVVTDAAGLDRRGARAVIHAVVHHELGDRAGLDNVRRAVAAALIAADRHRLRSVALPLLGLESDRTDPAQFIGAIVDELVAALRRSTLRIDRVTIVCRFDDHAEAARVALRRARDRAWQRDP